MADVREDRLRERLASYGAALDEAGAAPPLAKPRRHLIAVDGPTGGGRARRRPPWRGPIARAAAVVVVLAALAGSTWAATRPSETSTTTLTDRAWADDDVVRPEDRPSAFAALDGTWPLPPGASLEFVRDRPEGGTLSFAAFRRELAHTASCLWFRHAVEDPDLPAEQRSTLADLPSWPGNVDRADATRQVLVDAALAGDVEVLRRHLRARCAGTGAGLGLPDLGGRWLVAGGTSSSSGAVPDGSAAAVDPTQIRGWDAIVERLGPQVRVEAAVGFSDGGYNVSFTARRLHFSLTISQLDGPVRLPVTQATLDRGYVTSNGGVELFVGPVGDDGATIAQAVGSDGRSIALSFAESPDPFRDVLGNTADLAEDLRSAAWPR